MEVEGSSSVPVCSLSPAQLEVQAPDDGLKASVLDLKTPKNNFNSVLFV